MTIDGAAYGRALERVVDALRDGGHPHQVHGNHVQASCPLHDDAHPSLSIDQRGDRIFMFCHSGRGCTQEEISHAIGLAVHELWDQPAQPCLECGRLTLPDASGRYVHPFHADPTGARSPRVPRPAKPAAQPIEKLGQLPVRLTRTNEIVDKLAEVARYQHVDENGQVVAESVRKEGTAHREGEEQTSFRIKKFFQRYRTEDGRSLTRKPTDLVVPVWRLPEVEAAIRQGRWVHHCEGHKDAGRMLEHGLVATTNITTAFKADTAEGLRGALVAVMCDRDMAGYQRGLTAHKVLDGLAAAVRLLVPTVDHVKGDVSDHFDAGFGPDDFIEVNVDQLAVLHAQATIERLASDLGEEVLPEVRARLAAARDARSAKAGAEHAAAAARWAADGGVKLQKAVALATKIAQDPHNEIAAPAVTDAAVRQIQETVREAYELTGATPVVGIAALLERDVSQMLSRTPEAVESARVDGAIPGVSAINADADDDVGGGLYGSNGSSGAGGADVIFFPGGAWRPEHALPSVTPRQEWRYSTLEGRRGVYLFTKLSNADPGVWQLVSTLPHVYPPVVRRDGENRRLATDYRLAASHDLPAVTVDHLALRTGSWANVLGLPLSDDSKVIAQTGTAIRLESAKLAETEALVTFDTKSDLLALPQEPPTGFFECAPVPVAEAMDAWREVCTLMTPKQAHVVGASAISVFLRAIGIRSHVISMSGGSGLGKSTTGVLAGCIWGNALKSTSLYQSWNQSPQALPRVLGELRILPAFRDESGLARFEPGQWGQLIYNVTEGNTRTTPDRNGGYRTTRPWWGILFSTGNGEITNGLGAGETQGVPRRVIELSTPFTANRDAARRIYHEGSGEDGGGLLPTLYGHLGKTIAEQITTSAARSSLDQVRRDWPLTCALGAEDLTEQLYAHLAGATLVDGILGTQITPLAAQSAQEVLDRWAPPQSEAVRVLELITDSMDAEPSRWPTREQYLASQEDRSDGFGGPESRLPVHGVGREVLGLRTEDDLDTIWVLGQGWRELLATSKINTRLALQQLEESDVLWRTDGDRRSNEWQSYKKLQPSGPAKDRRGKRVYILRLSIAEDLRRPHGGNNVPPSPGPSTSAPSAGHPRDAVPGSNGSETQDVPGSDRPVPDSVPGGKKPLTCDVPGVPGFSEVPSRDECAREEQMLPIPPADSSPVDMAPGSRVVLASPGDMAASGPGTHQSAGTAAGQPSTGVLERMRHGETEPCVICLLPAWDLVNGHPCHLGECRRLLVEFGPDFRAGRILRPGTLDEQIPTAVPGAEAGSAVEPDDARPSTPDGGSASRSTGSARPSQPQPLRKERQRFAGPAAVLDREFAHLPGGEVLPWRAGHLGDVAVLASEKTGLRLGCGGGEDKPDIGQVWLTAAAIEALGLPAQLAWPADVDPAKWDQTRKELFAPFDAHPAVMEALRAGWQIGSGQGHLQVWTKLQHPQLLPRGAWLVFSSWDNTAATPLTADKPNPAELADRLARFADAFTVPFKMGPAVTGLRLIDHTRPPRQDETDEIGKRHNRAALIYGQPAELPPFLTNVDDPRFQTIEGDWRWWRLWDTTARSSWSQLLDAEKECRYIHGYDRGASYFAPWGTIDLGLDGLTHRTGVAVTWDGKSERPGYYRVGAWEWPTWTLPDPGLAARAHAEQGRWVTVHTLKQLHAHGVRPQLLESYTWEQTSRYLEPASKIIRAARAHQDPLVSEMAKLVYTRTGGKLAQRRGTRSAAHLLRPDWYDHIIAMSRTAILHTLTKNLPGENNPHGAVPLAVDHDAIFYASNDPDPVTAWPGDVSSLGTTPGKWKVIGSADLQTWGPEVLVDQTPRTGFKGFRTWNYDTAVAALQRHDRDTDGPDENPVTGSLEDEEQLVSEEDPTDG